MDRGWTGIVRDGPGWTEDGPGWTEGWTEGLGLGLGWKCLRRLVDSHRRLRLRLRHRSTMGRMYSRGKGISGRALPYKKSAPSWLKTTPQEVRSNGQTQAKNTRTKRNEKRKRREMERCRGEGKTHAHPFARSNERPRSNMHPKKTPNRTKENPADDDTLDANVGGGTNLQAGQERIGTVPDRCGAA